MFDGLDKITGRIITFEVALNETVQFGTLQVTPRVCYSRPPTDTPRTDAFAQVDEIDEQHTFKRIFSGWMFADSPGLHGVEHPIYDVWLVDCKGGTTVIKEAPPGQHRDDGHGQSRRRDRRRTRRPRRRSSPRRRRRRRSRSRSRPAVVAAPLPAPGDNAPLDLGGGDEPGQRPHAMSGMRAALRSGCSAAICGKPFDTGLVPRDSSGISARWAP